MHTPRLVLALIIAALPLPAFAASASITNLSPGTTVTAASLVSLTITPSGISYPTYRLQDSFGGSSASSNNIEPGGRFSWVPGASDAGTHVFTFTVAGSDSSASVSQTITVLPPPSLTISAPSPGSVVLPGTQLTFQVSTSGFTNPRFMIGDKASYSSITPANIDSSGRFSWTPVISDNGDHEITIYVSDDAGHNSSRSVSVRVGAGAGLAVMLLSPGASVAPGQLLTFTATPNGYSPTGFSVLDSFPNSTVSNSSINLSGQFSWVPAPSDVGTHILTITGVVGAFGDKASATQTITVTGPGGASSTPSAATSSDTTLAALQAKLAALTGALASAQAGSASVSPAAPTFTSYLKPGSRGDEVLALQKVLVSLGYLSATPNGNYGPATTAAVLAFQKARGLDALGVVGPATRAALNALGSASTPAAQTAVTAPASTFVFEHFMGLGDDDATQVTALQNRLTLLGYYSGPITGYFGPATEAAVKLFQKAKGLPETGYVASNTRAALNR